MDWCIRRDPWLSSRQWHENASRLFNSSNGRTASCISRIESSVAIEALASEIAQIAIQLPTDAADDYIERELSKFAVQMRRYEGLGHTPAASIGHAVNGWLRERVAAALLEQTRSHRENR